MNSTKSSNRWDRPSKVSRAESVFGGGGRLHELMPSQEEIPAEFKGHPGTKWNEIQARWFFEGLPDCANDLNAMNEAACGYFNSRSPGVGFPYIEHLCRLTGTPFGMSSFALAHATARQRAEAFLRTLGKWRD